MERGIMMHKVIKFNQIKKLFILIIVSTIIGIVVGGLDALFGIVLLRLSEFRSDHFQYLIWFLPLFGVIFTYLLYKYGNNSSQGMGLVFQVGHASEKILPKRMIVFSMVGTWLTHLFGGSAGREGVAVQLGATVANQFSKYVRLPNKTTIFLITGMAAGFAGLFQTPIGAIFFALEVLAIGKIHYEALLSSMIAAFLASFTSSSLGLEKFSVPLNFNYDFNLSFSLKLVLLGLVFGIVGLLFTYLLSKSKKYLKNKISDPVKRIGLIAIMLSILVFVVFNGRYSGLGTNLIESSFSNHDIYTYDFILKLLFTVLTLSAGFLGGEVTPLFAIGSSLGVILASFLNLPIELCAALGYCAVFASATNTFLAPILIGCEVFGFINLPYFFIVCAIAFLCNLNKSIYKDQKIVY